MTGRSTIAFAMLLSFAVAGCASAGAQGGRGGLADVPDARKLVRLTEKQYLDDRNGRLVVREDGTGKQTVEAFDAQDKPLDVYPVPLGDTQFCFAKPKQMCQTVNFASDGAIIKMGGASCYCYVFSGMLYCYGDTCR